jgi:tryptophanase
VIEVFEEIVATRESLRGLRIVAQPPSLRHFTAQFAPLP